MADFSRERVPYLLRERAVEYHHHHGDDNPMAVALLTYHGKDYDVPVILTRFTDRITGNRLCTLLDIIGYYTDDPYVVEQTDLTSLSSDQENMIYRWKCIVAAEQEEEDYPL